MEKRLILFIALSLLILLAWSALVPKAYHLENKEVIKKTAAVVNTTPIQSSPQDLPEAMPSSSSLQWSSNKYEINFSQPYAAIKEVEFKDFFSSRLNLNQGFYIADPSLIFVQESTAPEEVIFVHRATDKTITKRFYYDNSNYSMELGIKIQNLTNAQLKVSLPLILGQLDFGGDQIEARFQDVTVATPGKTLHPNVRREATFEDVKFLGLRNRYFCAIIEPEGENKYTAFINTDHPRQSVIGLKSEELVLAAQEQREEKFRIYLGPQDLKTINSIKPDWAEIVYYGKLNFISHLILQLLELLHRLARNWGLAIILLSIIIYIILYPLSLKQMRSMKEMQNLQPRVEELRKFYKDNPQKLNKEIMELYRVHKVNPLGGCLPLVLQMPIFFALYPILTRAITLKGARFLWIKDLSGPDKLFMLPFSFKIPLFLIEINAINILPIIMAIGMFFQQRLSLAKTSTAANEQQRLMLIIMPVMFGLIFYNMAAGFVLYWLTNSALMLFYQLRINKTTK